MSLKEKLIDAYGLNEISTDLDDEIFMKNHARVAFFNLSMTLKDGTPAQIPNFSFLYIGSIGSAYNLDALQQCNITHVLCLSGVIKSKFEHSFTYLRVPMQDKPEYNIVDAIDECCDFIDSVKHCGGSVLVHCYQGKSRSAAVCCAYMMRTAKLSYDQALCSLRTVRPVASPNSGFETTLRELERRLSQQDIDTTTG